MLKRQRASSPSPLTHATVPESLPISSDPGSSKHGVKRRRIFAPPLDGPSRGWGESSVVFGDDEDKADDIIMDGHTLTTWFNRFQPNLENASTYKSVNSLLHDLHAEQQHRRMMSSAANPNLQSGPFSSHGWPSQVPVARKLMHPLPQDPVTTGVKNKPRFEEVLSVYERYEETNRCGCSCSYLATVIHHFLQVLGVSFSRT